MGRAAQYLAVAIATSASAACGLATSGLMDVASPDAGGIAPSSSSEAGSGVVASDASAIADANGAGDDDASAAGGRDGNGDDDDASGEDASDAAVVCDSPTRDAGGAVARISPMPAPPKIDGNLNDWPCDDRILLTGSNAAYYLPGNDTMTGNIGLRWDASFLYVGVHVTKKNVGGGDGTNPWKNDAVEVYVTGDATPNGDYDSLTHQFIVDWKGLAVDYGPANAGGTQATNPPNFKAAVAKSPDGWTYEAEIGWQAFASAQLTAGLRLGLDVQIDNGDGNNQVGALLLAIGPVPASCGCTQPQCCCEQATDLPYCDSARISRTTLSP